MFLKKSQSNLFRGSIEYNRICRLLTLFGFVLILLCLLIILLAPPISGYEFSLYDAYPWIFWLFIIIAIFSGQSILLLSAFHSEKTKNNWIFGFVLIFTADFILLSLPLMRGYFINGSGDVLTHIGYMRDIITNSNLGSNYYPLDHIFGIILQYFTNLSIEQITYVIPLYFSSFYLIAWIPLAKVISKSREVFFLTLIFGSLLCFGNNFMAFAPFCQILLFFPFFLYLIFRMISPFISKSFHFAILLTTVLLALFHPLVAVLAMILLAILIIYKDLKGKELSFQFSPFFLFFIFVLLFLSWSSYLYTLIKTVNPIIQSILGNGGMTSEFTRQMSYLEYGIDPFLLIRHVFYTYGIQIIIGILFFMALFWIFTTYRNQNKDEKKRWQIMQIIVYSYFILFFLAIAMLFVNGSFGFIRIYNFAVVFSFFIIAGWFAYIISDIQYVTLKKMLHILFIIGIIMALTYLSVFTLYLSPLTRNSNQQVTESDYKGMGTFFSFRDEALKIFELGLSQKRFHDALYGVDVPNVNIVYYETNPLPKHFGYQSNESFNQLYSESRYYFILNKQGRFYDERVNPEFSDLWSYTPQDFSRFFNGINNNNIYSNDDLKIYEFNPHLG
ncbi:MAG: hypothetical protein ABSD81_01195 [Methanomicrobiales archaeon]|jgi:hypothetical protein